MIKRFLSLMLVVPLLFCCQPQEPDPVDPGDDPTEQPEDPGNQGTDPELYAKAAPELKSGSTVLATNPNVEKFLTEVNYPDKDWSYTKVLDYYGGFNNVKYDANGNPDPNGEVVKKPSSDKPSAYSIRWTPDASEGSLTLHLADNRGWSQDVALSEGKAYVDITNLVPNSNYTYKVTADGSGKVFAEVAAVEILAGGLLDQLRGGEAAAMLPDILPQPVEQGAEIALRNIAV